MAGGPGRGGRRRLCRGYLPALCRHGLRPRPGAPGAAAPGVPRELWDDALARMPDPEEAIDRFLTAELPEKTRTGPRSSGCPPPCSAGASPGRISALPWPGWTGSRRLTGTFTTSRKENQP